MNQTIKTLELAKLYESQGYFTEALEIYQALKDNDSDDAAKEVTAGLRRMEQKIRDPENRSRSGHRISSLLEQWLRLMILKYRLNNFKKNLCPDTYSQNPAFYLE